MKTDIFLIFVSGKSPLEPLSRRWEVAKPEYFVFGTDVYYFFMDTDCRSFRVPNFVSGKPKNLIAL